MASATATHVVAVVGGTHGNELAGVHLVRKMQRHPQVTPGNFATVFFCTSRRPLALRHPPTAVAYADLGAGDAMGRDLQPRSPGFRAPGDPGAAGAGQPDGGRTRRPLRRLRLEPLHGPGDPQPTRQVTVHPGQARRGPSVCESRTNPTPLLSTWTPASGAATSLSPLCHPDLRLHRRRRRPWPPTPPAGARELAAELGGAAIVLDLHNTTSNSGTMIIISDELDTLTLQLAAALRAAEPDRRVWLPVPPGKERVLCNVGSVAACDIGIELGPQAHGLCRADM